MQTCNLSVAFTIMFVKNELKHVIFCLRPSPYAIVVMKDLLQREGVISSLDDAYFWKMKFVHTEFNYKSNFMEVEDNMIKNEKNIIQLDHDKIGILP